MKSNDICKSPLFKEEHFGEPIPNDAHAISVCLPTWKNIIDYEERKTKSLQKMKSGYPRFVYHPLINLINKKYNNDVENYEIQLYPTFKSAQKAANFIKFKHPNSNIPIEKKSSVYAVKYSKEYCQTAKVYWQLTGEGISSRYAAVLLNNGSINSPKKNLHNIQSRLSDILNISPDDIFIYPSGMSAIHAAMNAIKKIHPDRHFCQFSFPYGDTLKLLEQFNSKETLFFPHGDEEDFEKLKKIILKTPLAGLFTEFPSNPLLRSVDLKNLRILANNFHFPIITDETLSALINTNVNSYSDISTISLTKYFSGVGNVMGGALIINPDQPYYHLLKPIIESEFDEEMVFDEDIINLYKNSFNVEDRVSKINQNTLTIVDYLKHHNSIEQVWHPSITDKSTYDKFRINKNGYGGVLSFTLKNAHKKTISFYDKLPISKGPNLGTSYSLCCPFVMLAHYNELEWAESMGASKWLIRLSVGLESSDDLISRLDSALN